MHRSTTPVVEVEPQQQRPRSRVALITGFIAVAIGVAVLLWSAKSQRASQDPLVGADFTQVTDFIGSEEHATISQDGRFIAFVSDRDGTWDVFVEPDRHRRLPEPDPRTDSRVAKPCGANARLLPQRIRADDLVSPQEPRAGAFPSSAATCAPALPALQSSTGLGTASASSTTPRHPATRYSSPVPMRAIAASRSTRRHRASIATSHSGRVMARRSTSCGASCRTKWTSGRFPPVAAIRSA